MLCTHKDDSEDNLGLPVYEDFKFTVSKSYGIHAAVIYIVPINCSACCVSLRIEHFIIWSSQECTKERCKFQCYYNVLLTCDLGYSQLAKFMLSSTCMMTFYWLYDLSLLCLKKAV